MAGVPPKLPPRQPMPRGRPSSPSATSSASHSSVSPRPRADTIHLTPYGRSRSQSPRFEQNAPNEPPPPYQDHWGSGDPRFMGDETSFKSFPAHVHNILTLTLAESHVVHTKIYPRYKSRRAIEFARDAFSNWYEPIYSCQASSD
jgi:hypothetical protein